MSAAFETARDFAAHGLRVFPTHSIDVGGRCTCNKSECDRAGKHPRTGRGKDDATTDERQLLSWNDRWPDANWAVACDRVSVIDIDTRHGADPREVIPEHELDEHPGVWSGEAPCGPLEGERGGHIYCAGGIAGGNTRLHGVEVRGIGLYAMLPGSRHVSGVAYEWMNGRRPWAVTLEPIPAVLTPQAAGKGDQDPPPAGERVPYGARHEHLRDFAVRLARAGVTDEKTLLAHIKVEFAERCDPEPEPERGSLGKLAKWAAKSRIAGRERGIDYEALRRGVPTVAPPGVGTVAHLAETPANTGDSGVPTPGTPGTPGTLRKCDVAGMLSSEPEPVDWLIEGVVARGTLTLLAGREKEGKSLMAMACAACGAGGGGALAGIHIEPLRVLIIDAENGDRELHRRLRSLGLRANHAARIEVYEATGHDLRRHMHEVEAVLAASKPDLLVLDSWRSLWAGDENDSGEVAKVLDPLRNLIRSHNAGAVLIHHMRKGGGYRGSSAIGASVENVIELSRHDEDPDRRRRRLRNPACRYEQEADDRWLRIEADRRLGLLLVEDRRVPPVRWRPRRRRRRPSRGAERSADGMGSMGPLRRP